MSADKDSLNSSRRKFLEASAIAAVTAVTPDLMAAESSPEPAAQTKPDSPYSKYRGLQIEKKDQVVTIRLPNTHKPASPVNFDFHWELGEIFSELRGDTTTRVVVVTGADDGIFMMPPDWHGPDGRKIAMEDSAAAFKTFTGILRFHEAMVALEKPIVARVNGHAIGTGQSIMFASDIIIAREDAIIADHHMAPIKIPNGPPVGTPNGAVAADGGIAWVPLYMSPAKAKEYLMLSKPYTAKEFEEMGVINYAVPASELDSKVNDIVGRLLQKSAYALAWTKRLLNRQAQDQMNRSLDAEVAYAWVSALQLSHTGYKDPLTLE
jgi:enoyl-CoA hydratase